MASPSRPVKEPLLSAALIGLFEIDDDPRLFIGKCFERHGLPCKFCI
jgi:hypothetical protein